MKRPYKLRESLVEQTKMSYAKESDEPHVSPDIDCSAGSNPFGMPASAKRVLGLTTEAQVNLYPHFIGLKHAIVRRYACAGLQAANLLLTDGSMGGLFLVNYAFLRDGARMLGIRPQFSEYPSHVRLMGMTYLSVPLDPAKGLAFDKDAVLAAIDDSLSLIYIDNPNNPTGQQIPIGALRDIAAKAREHGACLVIDEAYGDFIPDAESGLTLVRTVDNVIVLRTFSKGWGLAGLRAGYIAADERLIAVMGKLLHPYIVSEPARIVAAAAMEDEEFIPGCRAQIAARKRALLEAVGGKLRAAVTCDTVPIVLLTHEDEQVDLAAEFAKHGVAVVSAVDFESLGANSARLRLPDSAHFDRLLEIVRDIGRA